MPLLRRREFTARGPIPPWWRRPSVLAVVGLLVVGGVLTASEGVTSLLSSRQVRVATTALRNVPLPEGLAPWGAACGIFGVVCAQTALAPVDAAEAMAGVLRTLGHEPGPVRCGTDAHIATGTTLAGMGRHESQCTTTVRVSGGELSVAAWDFLPSASPGSSDGVALGRTAVVVEWDAAGTEQLLLAEPRLPEQRFADERLTPEEIAALPGQLATAECTGEDDEGCLSWEAILEGPGEGRELVEAWAIELLESEFLVTAFSCGTEGSVAVCGLSAESGRADGEMTRIGVRIDLDLDEPSRANAMVFTG